MARLEDYLVLNRYMHHLMGAEDFETLKNLLRPMPEGPDGAGQSQFFRRLATQPGLGVVEERLAACDRRVMTYEGRLRKARREFRAFRYFQYLALLYTEIFLERLTDDPAGFTAELNAFLSGLRSREAELADFPDFTQDGLRRLAFFMATGSGKTLLMHVNIWQVLYHLEHGQHAEVLVPGNHPRREFDNILLITPNEGLSDQHIRELRASGLNAGLFIEERGAGTRPLSPTVKVIEIHKLAEEVSGEGVSVPLEAIGHNNLVIVDEGHKGTGSEAQVWKSRQKYLSEGGFLLEYSATFAQAIAAAGKKAQKQLLSEYGQAILFDYSYAHFYADGYGKDFVVLNIQDSRPDQAHELLVGGLLTFYHQLRLYQDHHTSFRAYNLEKPLWVLLGSSVYALYTREKQRRSDVAEVVAFLRRFVEDRQWAVELIRRILLGQSGFEDRDTGSDLFAPHVEHLRGEDADVLYSRILHDVFHGSGGLEVWELKQADGEFGLRLSTADESAPYFGVINIGDSSAFKKYLVERMGLEAREDNFRRSQFDLVDQADSPIYLLIGAKKFIEGWSSWRVSSMGLLNVGKGAGSQIIQLFGRGVRLKGKEMTLKRSAALRDETPPQGIRFLETLAIFGWNADYIREFRGMIANEGLGKELSLRVSKFSPWPCQQLPVPQRKADFNPMRLTWKLDASGPMVTLDLTPRVHYVQSQVLGGKPQVAEAAGAAYGVSDIRFRDGSREQALLDWQNLYVVALEHKQAQGYENLYISPEGIRDALGQRCCVRLTAADRSPARLQLAAAQALRTYIDRFVRAKEREADSRHSEIRHLEEHDSAVLEEYRILVKDEALIQEIEALLKNTIPACDANEPLPRLHFDRSLFNPLLVEGGKRWKQSVSVHPPALNRDEKRFIEDLRRFWAREHDKEPFRDCELYLLRNMARTGIALFHRSGFYPDFILWLHNSRTGETDVIFLDPHGLHHGGLAGNADRFEALRDLSRLATTKSSLRIRGYLLTSTRVEAIPDAGGRSEADLEREYPLVFQRDHDRYIAKIFGLSNFIGTGRAPGQ